MAETGPRHGADAAALAADLIDRTGPDIRLALPLGLGKPVTLVNELVRQAAARPDVRLSILTALTLERPNMSDDMARRFLAPAADRLFGTSPPLTYARMLRAGTLPPNIEVSEFFFLAGRWLGVKQAQRHYIAANYTHALDVLRAWQPNLVLQLLAPEDAGGLPTGTFSLSCNTDITTDLLADRRAGRLKFRLAGEVNRQLPYMPGPAAEVPGAEVDTLLDDGGPGFDLFSVVKRPVGPTEHAIGHHVARLIRDGGTLQIGIGAIGDAVAWALLNRHRAADDGLRRDCPFVDPGFGQTGPFDRGLYCVTEMLVDGLLHLYEAGILRREVDGATIHAGFFVDSRDFYRRLREMPAARRAGIRMVPVSFTNALYGDEAAKRAARTDARFVNAAMKATLLGGVASDATDGGREVSGVGGQFNFVEQAFALDGARSVITLPATRTSGGRLTSNIVWDRVHETVPRQYRDIVVTEYGIADLRGKRDEEVVAAMLAIADSRFQDRLLEQAKAAGKIASDHVIPEGRRGNTPDRVAEWLRPHDLPRFPFGTDFDRVERRLLPALEVLSQAKGARTDLARLMWGGLRTAPREAETAALARMDLDRPRALRDRLAALALRGALHATRDG